MSATIFLLMSPTLSLTLLSVPQSDKGNVAFPLALPDARSPPQRITRSLLTGGFPFGGLCTELLDRDVELCTVLIVL